MEKHGQKINKFKMFDYNKDKKYLIISGGGLDSISIILLFGLSGYKNVEVITYDLGENPYEIIYSKKISEMFNYKFICYNAQNYKNLVLSNKPISEVYDKRKVFKFIGRNGLYHWLASCYAWQNNIDYLVNGSYSVDNTADGSRLFYDKLEDLFSLYGQKIEILTPLMDYSKLDLLTYMKELGYLSYIFENSSSCWFDKKECSECPPCNIRRYLKEVLRYGTKFL